MLLLCEHNISSATFILLLLPTARALSAVGSLLMFSALILLFAAVGEILPVMIEH